MNSCRFPLVIMLIGTIVTVFPLYSSGQTAAAKALNRCMEYYHSVDTFRFDVRVTGYPSALSSTTIDMGSGLIERMGPWTHSRYQNHELFARNDSAILLNHSSKKAYFAGDCSSLSSQSILPSIGQLDSLIIQSDSMIDNGIEKELYHISFFFNTPPYAQIDLFLDANQGFLRRYTIVYAPDDPQYTFDMYMLVIDYNPQPVDTALSWSYVGSMLNRNSSVLKLRGPFSEYSLHTIEPF